MKHRLGHVPNNIHITQRELHQMWAAICELQEWIGVVAEEPTDEDPQSVVSLLDSHEQLQVAVRRHETERAELGALFGVAGASHETIRERLRGLLDCERRRGECEHTDPHELTGFGQFEESPELPFRTPRVLGWCPDCGAVYVGAHGHEAQWIMPAMPIAVLKAPAP